MDSASRPDENHLKYDFVLETSPPNDLLSITRAVSEFCTSADISGSSSPVLIRLGGSAIDWPGSVNMQEVTRWEREIRRVERLPRVLVAIVHGYCAGPALDFLLACDLRIASPQSAFRLAFNQDSAWPGMSIYRLVHQIGSGHVRRTALLGTEMDARKAAAVGLVDELDPEPWRRAQEMLPSLCRLSGKEVAVRRALVLEAPFSPYDDALGAHLAACARELRRLAAAKQP